MSSTLVIQSHRSPLPFPWLEDCLQSVRQWAQHNQFDYLFLNNEFFDEVPQILLDKTRKQTVIATDLARLFKLQYYLRQGYQTVVWCDADFLIFDPEQFVLEPTSYALGREVWVQYDKQGKLKSYSKVHNAFMLFRQGNSFLDFYTESAERLLRLTTGDIPPQFIGPKLLSAIHNIVRCPVQENAGMLSPLVLQDIAAGGGDALDLFIQQSAAPIAAGNLCSSEAAKNPSLGQTIEKVINQLLEKNPSTAKASIQLFAG